MSGAGDYRIKPARRRRISAQEMLLADMGVGAVSAT
jgi:hypothetical protein